MTNHPPTLSPACRPRRRAAAWLLALVGSGCTGGLLPKPPAPPARFTLDDGLASAPGTAGAAGPGAPSIVVAVPTAAPGFDSTRMVYLRQPQALQAYAFHEWADTPARLLAPLLVRALQQQGGFRTVLQAPSSAAGALRLETEVLRLQHEHFSRPSRLRLTLRAVLIDSATRQPLATREFDASIAAPSDDPAGAVAAAASATRQALAALAEFAARYAGGGAGATGPTGTRREP